MTTGVDSPSPPLVSDTELVPDGRGPDIVVVICSPAGGRPRWLAFLLGVQRDVGVRTRRAGRAWGVGGLDVGVATEAWWGLPGLSTTCKGRAGCRPGPAVDDLVQRQFSAPRPDAVWFTDITEHPMIEGKLYCCAIEDVFSNRIV